MIIDGEIDKKKIEIYEKRKADLKEQIAEEKKEVEILKEERKSTKKHILVSELPEDERLQRLNSK